MLSLQSELVSNEHRLEKNQDFVDYIYHHFNWVQHDPVTIQVTGIDKKPFDNLEKSLCNYLQKEFEVQKIPASKIQHLFEKANSDHHQLKRGVDTQYNYQFSAYSYFLE